MARRRSFGDGSLSKWVRAGSIPSSFSLPSGTMYVACRTRSPTKVTSSDRIDGDLNRRSIRSSWVAKDELMMTLATVALWERGYRYERTWTFSLMGAELGEG